jgi:predicted DNA repair protein MutK
MAASGLLALIDDVASLLDDVALLTRVAARKTAGVIGDDLALNAEQVTGMRADREIPVIWAVAKGALLNKAILVPVALGISAWLPAAITPLLMIGGAFLCFEGAEKLWDKLRPESPEHAAERLARVKAVADPAVDLVAFEKTRIRGAVRTDFILSAEIVVIALGTMSDEPIARQVAALTAIGLGVTVLVYGLVAGLVKLDDLGCGCGGPGGRRRGAFGHRAAARRAVADEGALGGGHRGDVPRRRRDPRARPAAARAPRGRARRAARRRGAGARRAGAGDGRRAGGGGDRRGARRGRPPRAGAAGPAPAPAG